MEPLYLQIRSVWQAQPKGIVPADHFIVPAGMGLAKFPSLKKGFPAPPAAYARSFRPAP
jgi:hypothetical protein